ncbi:lysis protein [Pseudomonas cichorii]|uniref:lysis system i-spanin subunit Rz n=1 Tax=Pseudomonas cichorii TaxID=36746 RepID=UPI001C88D10B|nr:lysis system i-spanin subunit Rz [Pseudomonas cichorii]MBX8512095.1 lysis protein [Pseudomonas cichorii]MBX8516799.1 lysis protein [Pseudomonas cichorii]MBX8527075.1 lysis protein [Pseudomonas cichorii]MBX8604215.1 lysis protein [Pseudomonas cichorii]
MKLLDLRAVALALLLGLGLGAWAAWQWQASSYGQQLAEQAQIHLQERELASRAVIAWQEAQQKLRRDMEARLQTNDATHYKELSDAQKLQARLRSRLATSDLRLSVLLAAPASGRGEPAAATSGSLVHGASRGELDPAAAQRIVAITDDGDQGLIALKACQAYVREIAR